MVEEEPDPVPGEDPAALPLVQGQVVRGGGTPPLGPPQLGAMPVILEPVVIHLGCHKLSLQCDSSLDGFFGFQIFVYECQIIFQWEL